MSSTLTNLSKSLGRKLFGGSVQRKLLPRPPVPTIYEDERLEESDESEDEPSRKPDQILQRQPILTNYARQERKRFVSSYYRDVSSSQCQIPPAATRGPSRDEGDNILLYHPDLTIPVGGGSFVHVSQ
ncbi:expressed unknown protein [Seminavis robusta]|uniref:Uncharacterized protein n=1 Tax=Seminavis robusta TaxID=568900 RepID=A0A9N8HIG1_9STRA|nr:expressed unknown protein [Seminavis robusta]|eukprot:Sro499_g155030.1 n/a (128) ;mRNA; f:22521-23022